MESIRENFIKDLSESVQKSYLMLWKKVRMYERDTKQEFEQITPQEAIDFCREYLIGKSSNSMCVKISLLKKYLNSIGNKAFNDISRPMVRQFVDDYLAEKNTNESEVKYVPWNVLKYNLKYLDNDIDKAIVCLLRLSVYGNRFTELANLKVEDINLENRTITLTNRVVDINDDEVLNIIKQGIEQRTYYVILKDSCNAPKTDEYEFNMQCPYVIKQRPIGRNNYGLNNYSFSGITARVFRIFEFLDMNISTVNMVQSWAIDKVLEYEEQLGRKISMSETKSYLTSLKIKVAYADIYEIVQKLR